MNVAWVRGYIDRLAEAGRALASRKTRFDAVAEFLAWCERRKLLRENPCELIDRKEKPWTGKRAKREMGRGKAQLRNTAEVRAYVAACRLLSRPRERVAAALPVLTGLRSGAIRHLRVADVDFEAGRIWTRDIDDDDVTDVEWNTKTASSRMTVDLPSDLRADLLALCRGRAPGDYVFPSKRHKSGQPGPFERKWLNGLVKRACAVAETRVVCAHGARDTYSSILAALAGRTAIAIAPLMGHDDDGQTAKKHYIGVPQHHPAESKGRRVRSCGPPEPRRAPRRPTDTPCSQGSVRHQQTE